METASWALVFAALCIVAPPLTETASAGQGRWSATLYGGPSSTKFVTQILSGSFDVNGGMVGLAVDRKIINLGSGISFGAEAQLTQFFGKYAYSTGALGVGFRFDRFPCSKHLPTTMAIFSGPSYAPNAPIILDPTPHPDPKFLNFVGIEIAFAVSDKWDAGLRVYHRSGAWGTYSNTADVGSMIGLRDPPPLLTTQAL